MSNQIIPLHTPEFGEEEIQAACEQMRTTHVTMGKKVREFEEQCASHFGTKYCVMVNSGSSANLLTIAALSNPAWTNRLEPGDEVIVPALSWATTVWPIIQHNLIPVFVDCDLNTYNFDIHKLEESITPKTRAIMLVHVYGNPCDMKKIRDIAKRHNLYVIGDCCEAMGATYNGLSVGAFGIASTMSLYYSHHITTFEGGLIFTNDFNFAELLRILRAHGWSREADDKDKYIREYPKIDPRFIFVNIGYNLRPTEVQAAIGIVQLPKLSRIVKARQNTWIAYRGILQNVSSYLRFQTQQYDAEASWFGFGIILKDNAPFTVKQITSFLESKGIETRPIIAGNIARHPALKMFPHRISGTLENCDIVMQYGFAIGCQEYHSYIPECINEFISNL